ncbi:MAG: RidA family protein [Chloroflexi bacterium]|nr:RidA family protein [Chloroflexota bacterium]MBV9544123.1 RidA family protein [Chloroflexota bacterium]
MTHQIVQPDGWPAPRGYSNGVVASGRILFVAGQIGWDKTGRMRSDVFVEQARQALSNVVEVLEAGGARPEHIVRMTWYVVDKREYQAALREIGQMYRELIGAHYPAMTLVQVADLLEDGARVEIEATAVIPG